MRPTEGISYEPNERCPLTLSTGVGFQGMVLALMPTVLTMSLFAQASGLGEDYLSWAVLVAIALAGIVTALQSARLRRFGSGHNLLCGPAPSYMAIALLAVDKAGPETLASLVVASSVFQFALAWWLPALRRIITPMVTGILIMLIAAGVIQVVVGRLGEPTEGAEPYAAPAVAAVMLIVTALLGLRATGALRLWTPLIGILAGCAAAGLLGLYDAQRVVDAPWVGVPDPRLPGLDLTPGAEFWSLLPMFLIVSLAGAIKAIGSNVVMQRISWREPKVTDYRLVQGTVNANGLGGLVSGVAGILPSGSMDATTISLTNFTGVAARRVGYTIGVMLVALVLLPKFMALLLTIPSAVTSAFFLFIMGMLFLEGMRTVLQDGLDPRRGLIVGISLSVGLGLQGDNVVADLIGGTWGTVLGNGMTVGGFTAIVLTMFLELSGPRRRRLEVDLHIDSLSRIDAFLEELATRVGWSEDSANRLRLVGEEALLRLLDAREDETRRRLVVTASSRARIVELEFLAALEEEENIEDRLAYLSEQAEASEEREFSLRLLRHYASGVRHRKYHGIDIVTVEVEG